MTDPDAPDGSNGAAEDPNDPVAGEIPGPIWELAENCRSFVVQALGIEIDYEPETLPLLDEYLRRARTSVSDRPEALPLVAQAVAAYFGEVVRRRIDGMWRPPRDPNADWKICGRRAFVSMSPLGMVLDSLAQGAEHAGPPPDLELAPDDEQLAEERLAVFPPVTEDEYFLLSTRLEVVEAVVNALRDRMKTEGRESLVFEESDYDDE